MSHINFGFHASAGGNIEKLPLEAKKLGGECFQFFSRNPYGGKVLPLSPEKVEKFKDNCHRSEINNYYIHTPYFINLASRNNRIFYGGIKAISVDLERAKALGAKFVVTHLGSGKDYKMENSLFSQDKGDIKFPKQFQEPLLRLSRERNFSPAAFTRVIEGLEAIVGKQKKVPLLLEIAAGAGAVLGEKIEEIAYYLKQVPALAGFCLDTAHAFASGYDLRDGKELDRALHLIERSIGKDKLKLIHLNDSSAKCGSRVDRHAHLGEGQIGRHSFKKLVGYLWKNKYNLDMILETPTEEGLIGDLELLKKYRSNL
ncbi:MAG: deoxyribonuclease IV [Candidatus Moranbacteria bacterium]|nr:deoxyribonuclease IV [Candidatus Moranbacteria bacterium]